MFGARKQTALEIQNLLHQENIETTNTDDTTNESRAKFEAIVQLLLAAGYFRARIAGLSPFDKVIGGLVWCISSSNVDVNVNVFFKENLIIGQRIKLAEKIISLLVKMKCPLPLQAQQIQGLDYISLFPIFQWLVRKVLETREENSETMRQVSNFQFCKNYSSSFLNSSSLNSSSSLEINNSKLISNYSINRKFKRKTQSKEINPQSILLEYGRLYSQRIAPISTTPTPTTTSTNEINNDDNNNLESSKKLKNLESSKNSGKEMNQKQGEAETRKFREMASQLDSITTDSLKSISTSKVGQLMGTTMSSSSSITSAAEEYTKTSAALAAGDTSLIITISPQEQLTSIQMRESRLDQQLEEMKERIKNMHNELTSAKSDAESEEDSVSQLLTEIQKISDQTNSLTKGVKDTSQLKSLFLSIQSLQEQETSLQDSLVSGKIDLEKRIETAIQEEEANESDDEISSQDEELQQLSSKYVQVESKWRPVKEKWSSLNQEIAIIKRQIDEIPTRAELIQYQQRYVELYEQVASKEKETRKNYERFNALEEERGLLKKELELIASIHNNYSKATNSRSQETFLAQLQSALTSVKRIAEKVSSKHDQNSAVRDSLNESVLLLINKQREYIKAVKQFQDECNKNEQLQKQIQK